MKDYSPIVLRFGIVFVFLWFGINQLVFTDDYISYLPEFLLSSESAHLAVIVNGSFEIILAGLLLIGLFTKFSAFLLSINLLMITISLGYNDIAVRDLGLTIATFAIFLGGEDRWCLDRKQR